MSEEKVIQHAKKAISAVGDKKQGWLERIKEFLYEVVIIVIAVSLTLALHNWNDRRHERQIEKDFLESIREDLQNDATDVEASITTVERTTAYYDSVWRQMVTNKINKGYVDSNSYEMMNTSYFSYDDGGFESFKSSGYLRLIENKQLLRHLTSLYTDYLPFEVSADRMIYDERRQDYNTYIGVKAPVDTSGYVHISALLNDPEVKHQILYYGSYLHERIRHKKQIVQRMRAMAKEIDGELKKW